MVIKKKELQCNHVVSTERNKASHGEVGPHKADDELTITENSPIILGIGTWKADDELTITVNSSMVIGIGTWDCCLARKSN